MGKHSRKNSGKGGWGTGRERARFEDRIGSGSAGSARSRDNSSRVPTARRSSQRLSGNAPTGRVERDIASAQITGTDLIPESARGGKNAPARLMAERDRRRQRQRKRTIAIVVTVACLLIAAVAGGLIYYKVLSGRMVDQDFKPTGDVAEQPKAADPYNIVLFGGDARKGQKAWRSDVMILCHVNPETKKIWMISLPRDLKVKVEGHGTQKLNAAYAFGKATLAVQTIEEFTGQHVDHFLSVNFTGFEKIVDSMGGIEINVPVAISDPKATYPKGAAWSKIDKGKQILDGKRALVFVRSRAYPTGDYQRMKNQQAFFKALAKQMGNVEVTKMPGLIDTVSQYVTTDLSPLELLDFAKEMRGVTSANMETETLPSHWSNEQSYVIQSDKEKKEAATLFKKFENEEPFKDEETTKTATAASTMKPSEVAVTVRNGTTKSGIAKQAAAVLKARGFDVGEVGNMENQSVYDETLIIYKSKKAAAELVAKYLPEGIKLVESRGMYSYDTEVMVVLGKNWDIEKVPVADVKTN
ncbi:MAG: LCP family protein [Actinomycetes bacterium]|nr:LCP family protein [Actinomycetes bacterium]